MSKIPSPPPISTYGGDRPQRRRPAPMGTMLSAALLVVVIVMLGVLLGKVNALQKDVTAIKASISQTLPGSQESTVPQTTAPPTTEETTAAAATTTTTASIPH